MTTNRNVHALIGTPHTDRLLHSAPEIKTLETAQREGEGDEEGDIESDSGFFWHCGARHSTHKLPV